MEEGNNSTDELNIQAQLEACRKYCEEHGIEIVSEYVDADGSLENSPE